MATRRLRGGTDGLTDTQALEAAARIYQLELAGVIDAPESTIVPMLADWLRRGTISLFDPADVRQLAIRALWAQRQGRA